MFQFMSGVATVIELTEEDRATLERGVRGTSSEQRFVQRARIVLEAAAGNATKDIASKLHTRAATVSKWRTRFAEHGLSGLADAPRPGKPRVIRGKDEGRETPSRASLPPRPRHPERGAQLE